MSFHINGSNIGKEAIDIIGGFGPTDEFDMGVALAATVRFGWVASI